jgi:DEAD/DEAH box helicase domain-containing protein
VASRTIGYKKIKLYTAENCGFGDVHLPDVEMHTTSLWLALDGKVLREAGYRGLDVVDGLLGLGKVMRSLAALHLMCDPSDLGMALADPEDSWVAGLDRGGHRSIKALHSGAEDHGALDTSHLVLERPTLFLHDAMPGGVGFAEKLFQICDVLLSESAARIVACHCESGCPSCVGPLGEVDEGACAAALDLGRWLAGVQKLPLGPAGADEFLTAQRVISR